MRKFLNIHLKSASLLHIDSNAAIQEKENKHKSSFKYFNMFLMIAQIVSSLDQKKYKKSAAYFITFLNDPVFQIPIILVTLTWKLSSCQWSS